MREFYKGHSIEVAQRHDRTDWIVRINGEVQVLAHESAAEAQTYAHQKIDVQTVVLDAVA